MGEGRAEHPLAFKNTLSMMAQGPVPEIAEAFLGGLEPVVNRQIIFGLPPPHISTDEVA